jgi:large subunit ribosomal protein L15e
MLVDPSHKSIKRDAKFNWMCRLSMKHTELKWLTAVGKKYRGLSVSGRNDNKKDFQGEVTGRVEMPIASEISLIKICVIKVA